MKSIFHFLLGCLLVLAPDSSAQLRPARSVTPLPYFEDLEQGFVVLRDGSRIDGNISLRNLEKDDRIGITDKSGKKYSLDPCNCLVKDFRNNCNNGQIVFQIVAEYF